MKVFVKSSLMRYVKLPFKFVYWLGGCFFFLIAYLFIWLNISKKKTLKQFDKSVLCVSHVSISFDGRIKKCANQLLLLGFSVVLMKPYDAHEDDIYERSGLDEEIKVKRLGLSGSFSYFPCILDPFMLLYMIFCKHSFLHCHDINTAFMGLVASKITGKKLISDLHEWKSETSKVDGDKQHSFQKKIYKIIEDIVVKESDFVITVNDTIASELNKNLKKERKIFIVKNCPTSLVLQPYNLRLKLNIPDDHLIGYYVGQMAPYRNIAPIIQAIHHLPNICLVFQGTIDDAYLQTLKDMCQKLNISNRVFFLPPIPYDLIPSSCQGADIGLFTCNIRSESMRSSLPNKLFEYISGGIPVMSEDIPLMRNYIEAYNIGIMMQSTNIETIIKAFKFIKEKNVLINMKRNILLLKEKFISETNEENQLAYTLIYRSG